MKVEVLGWWLVVLGGLNWGLVGLGTLMGSGDSWNIVEMVFVRMPGAANFVYLVIGLAALWKLWHKLSGK